MALSLLDTAISLSGCDGEHDWDWVDVEGFYGAKRCVRCGAVAAGEPVDDRKDAEG